MEGIPELTDLLLVASDGKEMVSANCTFGSFALLNTNITGIVFVILDSWNRDERLSVFPHLSDKEVFAAATTNHKEKVLF